MHRLETKMQMIANNYACLRRHNLNQVDRQNSQYTHKHTYTHTQSQRPIMKVSRLTPERSDEQIWNQAIRTPLNTLRFGDKSHKYKFKCVQETSEKAATPAWKPYGLNSSAVPHPCYTVLAPTARTRVPDKVSALISLGYVRCRCSAECSVGAVALRIPYQKLKSQWNRVHILSQAQ